MSTLPTIDVYRARVPAHTAIVDATIQVFFADAALQLNPEAWGDLYQLAVVYWTAHTIEMTPGLGSVEHAFETNQLVQQGDGKLNRQYAQPQFIDRNHVDEWMRRTVYGQAWLQLRAQLPDDLPFVVVPTEATRAGL